MDIYNRKRLSEMIDEDEIDGFEQGFMHGYLEAFNIEQYQHNKP